MTDSYAGYYRGRRVLVTGGLGFIGSNLARRLIDLGADVLVVDSMIPEYGGNLFNLNGVEDRLRAFSVVAVNSWMNQPQGFSPTSGNVTSVQPFKVIFNKAVPYEVPHMILAAYLVTGVDRRVGLRGGDAARAA